MVDSGRKKLERYSSRIEGITDNHLHLAMPMRKSVPVLLFPGTKFYGRFIAFESAWQFTSIFIDKKILPVPIWISSLPTEFEKIQLREHVRLQATLPLQFTILAADGESPPFKGSTKDISGGGIQLMWPKPIPIGTKLNLTLDIPETGAVNLQGDIVRREKPGELEIYWLAVKFTDITERDREKIIKYIFKLQIERRQKGLLT